jgi:hypothetical protein
MLLCIYNELLLLRQPQPRPIPVVVVLLLDNLSELIFVVRALSLATARWREPFVVLLRLLPSDVAFAARASAAATAVNATAPSCAEIMGNKVPLHH